MKIRLLVSILALAFVVPAATVTVTGCKTPVNERTIQVQTLKIVGTLAKNSMDSATQLLKQGEINIEQWQKVATFYDTRWQTAYALAVAAVSSDLSSAASPDLVALAGQLAALVSQFTTSTK